MVKLYASVSQHFFFKHEYKSQKYDILKISYNNNIYIFGICITPGIFQKKGTQWKYRKFWIMEYFDYFPKLNFTLWSKFFFNMNMEYFIKNLLQENINIFGIWNIARNLPKEWYTIELSKKFHMEYSRNSPKKRSKSKYKKMEYGIFHRIFLEFSKKKLHSL